MKKLIYLAMSALSIVSAGMLTGCSADKYEMISENGSPDASLIDVTVTVDQETNRYTLHLNTPGYYPYWSVNTGSSVKTSAQNDFSGVIAEAGTYPVEVRIGNYNGLSEPKMYEIVIENSLAGDVFKGFDYNSEFNMWKNANVALGSTWFADGGWAELSPQPSVEVSNERIFLHTPAAEWGMTPQTVNAYYNPLANEIVFPAAILQAPFFNPEASDAENYGGIGVVIGHEMTHGFDDQGRNFDANGNMTNWWTQEDAEKFQALTNGLVEQFNEVEVLPGLHANGAFTLGENIADQGGLRVSMTAFKKAQKDKGVDIDSPEALIDGFTPTQVFYMNYANIWAMNIRPEEISSLTTRDPHSLSVNRVNVTLRNIAPFFEAFGIKDGDPLYRPESERVIIW